MRVASKLSDSTLHVGVVTDPGRTDKNNEDDYVIFETRAFDQEGIPGPVLVPVLVVADGIGGNTGGELASDLATRTVRSAFEQNEGLPIRQRLVEAAEAANSAIYEQAMANPNLTGMGTTIVIAALVHQTLYVAHAGDSRAYVIRGGHAHLLTIDHTWAQEAIAAGRLTATQARTHPNRHVIKRFLGISPTVDIDTEVADIAHGPLDPDQVYQWPKSSHVQLQPGDAVLLCSDGLTDVVTDRQIEQIVIRYRAQDAAKRLVDLANKAGGPDNITVVVVRRGEGKGLGLPLPPAPLAIAAALILIAGLTWAVLAGPLRTVLGTGVATTAISAVPDTATVIAQALTPEPPTATPAPTEIAVSTATASPSLTPTADATTAARAATAAATINEQGVAVATTLSGIFADADPLETLSERAISPEPITTPALVGLTTPTPVPTPSRPPTSTPLPDETATPTPTATPTATETFTPAPTATRGPTNTPRPTTVALNTPTTQSGAVDALPANARVTLTGPADGDTLQNRQTFSWQPNFDLPAGYAFEPFFWPLNSDLDVAGRGYGGSTRGTQLTISTDTFQAGGAVDGQYQWGVFVIQPQPYRRIQQVSETRTLRLQLSSSGSDSGGGGSDGGSSGDPPRED